MKHFICFCTNLLLYCTCTVFQFFLAIATRIRGGGENWGRVEVYNKGIWGQVCMQVWDTAAATVVCRSLGFSLGTAFGTVVDAKMPYWLTDLKCNGTEKHLEQCNISQWAAPSNPCSAAYVLCHKKGKLRSRSCDSCSLGR